MAKIIDRQQQQSKNSSITYRIELYDDDNINRLIERPLQSRVFVVHIDRQSDNVGDDNNRKIIGHFSVQLLIEQNSTTTTTNNQWNGYRIRIISMINKNRLLNNLKKNDEKETLYSKQQQMPYESMDDGDNDDDDEWIIISNEEFQFNPITKSINQNGKNDKSGLQSFKSITATNSKSIYIFNDDYDDEEKSTSFVVAPKSFAIDKSIDDNHHQIDGLKQQQQQHSGSGGQLFRPFLFLLFTVAWLTIGIVLIIILVYSSVRFCRTIRKPCIVATDVKSNHATPTTSILSRINSIQDEQEPSESSNKYVNLITDHFIPTTQSSISTNLESSYNTFFPSQQQQQQQNPESLSYSTTTTTFDTLNNSIIDNMKTTIVSRRQYQQRSQPSSLSMTNDNDDGNQQQQQSSLYNKP
ncbi:hypothetical protein DERP_007102 [Dermatophagoides pteronyssinus]|uniref:Uncharacterized protein n=1 Tax=Dermatophagoides pteronyssinus TaxID=6956 RepID=A0ABQ8JV89_DERPT|nr:hypothetical protein DERP_007102 [Dermatophagoides pteronyssinus]